MADDDQITERLPHELAKFKDFAGFLKVEPRLDGYATSAYINPYRIGWENFIRHVAMDAPFVSGLSTGIRDVQLAEAFYRSVSEQKWITLDEVVN